jgi:predicted  nucleic acid-binding Zn-ribbon protein
MRDQEALIERLNHQSAQVSSNQAYTALQHELDAAEAAKTEFETAALEQMETIDRARGAVAEVEVKLAGLEDTAPEKYADIDARKAVLEGDLAKQLELRAKECAGIAVAIMSRYDRIRARKQPAIAVIEGKSCPECKIVLPRMVVSEVLRLEQFHECTSCKRLLIPAAVVADES